MSFLSIPKLVSPFSEFSKDQKESIFSLCGNLEFVQGSFWEKIAFLSRHVAEIISSYPAGFFLPALLCLFQELERDYQIEGFVFSSFERWLFLDSGYSAEKQQQIRGKISGKYFPDLAFQGLFPIGMQRTYPGPHVVCAHVAPDTDTIVSSFLGWLDAFSLGVSASGRHIWFVPGGPPKNNVEVKLLFQKILGVDPFRYIAATADSFVLTAGDLIDISYFSDINKLEGQEIASVSATTSWEVLYAQAKSAPPGGGWFRVLYEDALLGFCSLSQIFREYPGTISLRDFSNPKEGNLPPYLALLSVVDHHKSSIKSIQVSAISVQDLQSTNAILANMHFQWNDLYGDKGLSLEEIFMTKIEDIHSQIEQNSIKAQILNIESTILRVQKEGYYIFSSREWLEYIFFLYAIFDDTDLLIKVSHGDLVLLARLLNRLFSFYNGWGRNLFDLEFFRDTKSSLKNKSSLLLQNEFVYNFYKEIYAEKEIALNVALQEVAEGSSFSLFDDTKIQNQYSRVGQCKLYPNNFTLYTKHRLDLRSCWMTWAQKLWEKEGLRFHIQMISWLPDATALFSGDLSLSDSLKDELWVWAPDVPEIQELLVLFLERLRRDSPLKQAPLDLFLSKEGCMQRDIKRALALDTSEEVSLKEKGGIFLSFPPLLMHSRKASVSPFLPKSS